MQTRSQQMKPKYEVEIDFEDASNAWRSNKISMGNGMYNYRCSATKRDGCQCSQAVSDRTDYCKMHLHK